MSLFHIQLSCPFLETHLAYDNALIGLNEASATIVDKFGVHDKPEDVEKMMSGH